MSKLKIIECPRDAMQSIKEFIPTDKKIKYVQKQAFLYEPAHLESRINNTVHLSFLLSAVQPMIPVIS